MREQLTVRCLNCGTPLEAPAEGATGVECPVCHFTNDLGAPPAFAMSTESFEARLGELIGQARVGGLAADEIVRVLRDELEFAAELASGGRQLTVQIIDLGPLDVEVLRRPARDRTSTLRGRTVGG